MIIKNEADIIKVIKEDRWMMDILGTVDLLNLPDWWVCAGFIRSKIWDVQHQFSTRTPLPDIDVIYFDKDNTEELIEKEIEAKLYSLAPNIPWSVKNQARMHLKNDMPPYTSSIDGISKFPETVTALGVKLDYQSDVKLIAPWGVHDVVNLKVRPTPSFTSGDKIKIYQNRVREKEWKNTWKNIRIYAID